MAYNMKGSPMQRNFGSALYKKESKSASSKKTTQEERDAMTPAERLLAVVPNEGAYNKLKPEEKISFDKAAKAAGLPQKLVKK